MQGLSSVHAFSRRLVLEPVHARFSAPRVDDRTRPRVRLSRVWRCPMDTALLAAPAELQSGRIERPSARASGIAKWQPFVASLDGATL